MCSLYNSETRVTIGATNRIDMIDEAALRPKRFEVKIYMGLPDIQARKCILRIHTKDLKLCEDVNLEKIAQETEYYTGADLESLCNEAWKKMVDERVYYDSPKLSIGDERYEKECLRMDDFRHALNIVKSSASTETKKRYDAVIKGEKLVKR